MISKAHGTIRFTISPPYNQQSKIIRFPSTHGTLWLTRMQVSCRTTGAPPVIFNCWASLGASTGLLRPLDFPNEIAIEIIGGGGVFETWGGIAAVQNAPWEGRVQLYTQEDYVVAFLAQGSGTQNVQFWIVFEFEIET